MSVPQIERVGRRRRIRKEWERKAEKGRYQTHWISKTNRQQQSRQTSPRSAPPLGTHDAAVVKVKAIQGPPGGRGTAQVLKDDKGLPSHSLCARRDDVDDVAVGGEEGVELSPQFCVGVWVCGWVDVRVFGGEDEKRCKWGSGR